MSHPSLEVDGVSVRLYRGSHGKLVVDILTEGASGDDVVPPHDLPSIYVVLNGGDIWTPGHAGAENG